MLNDDSLLYYKDYDPAAIGEFLQINETDKAGNRLRADTAVIYGAIVRAFIDAGYPQTVRQLFYKLTSYGVVPKTENGYGRVCYHSLKMRQLGILPYQWLADNTRWMRKSPSYDDIGEFLQYSRDAYRRSIWNNQDAYVEVWLEKDALAGVLIDITNPYDVPLMVTRGYSSATYAYEAACEIVARQEAGKVPYIYYFGDYDPSGLDIPRDLLNKLQSHGAFPTFEIVAVQKDQIAAWRLPTRPTKRSDSRAKGWEGESVELDAIPANQLRVLCQDVIQQHIDPRLLHETQRVERLERESLAAVVANFRLA
jgi:hypothetical protein